MSSSSRPSPGLVPERESTRHRGLALLAPLFLILAVALAFGNTMGAPFLFDDLNAITHNPSLARWDTVLTPPSDGRATSGRPVVNLSFAFNRAINGDRVWSYHALNILIHASAALALFGILRRTLAASIPPRRFAVSVPAIAFVSALLWAIHPLQTESVTAVAQRTESLCGLFFLLTLYGFIRGVATQNSRSWLIVSVVASLAGMGTKEVMVSAPLLVFLYDRTFIAGNFAAAWQRRRTYYLALFATWLLLGWLVFRGGGTRGPAAGLGLGVGGWAYLLKQTEAIVLYLKLALWPHPLVIDYGTSVATTWSEVWWQGLIVLTLLGVSAWALWKHPKRGFFCAWFFLILAPSSSFVPLVAQTMAEHRMYLPLAALIVPAVLTVASLPSRRALAALLSLALVFALLTVRRNTTYRSELSLWRDTVRHVPDNARAQVNLGVALSDAGLHAEAIEHFEAAVSIGPPSARARLNLCAALLRVGRPLDALPHGEEAVRLDPQSPDAHIDLAHALAQLGRGESAVLHYEKALEFEPDASDARAQLGSTLLKLGRVASAIENLQTALNLDPERAETWCTLARAHQQQNDLPSARRAAQRALQLRPDFPEALYLLGNLDAAAGNFTAAIARFQRATELAPDYIPARNNLANALLLNGQTDAAIAQYRTILRERPNDRAVQENLARALELQANPPPR